MTAATASIRHTLRSNPTFRGLCAGGLLYFIGNAMQVMATSWLMVELTGSAILTALVQTAVFLPMFLLSLPAGVLADVTDRRRLLVVALLTQAALMALLTLLLLLDAAGATALLFFTFAIGCCTALLSPAWNTTVADSVPRAEMPQAITLVGIAYNSARALGPTLAGVVFAYVGSDWVFGIAVLTTLLMWESIRRWPPNPHPPSRLPAERLWGGTLAALRFARHSDLILAQLVRTMAYSAAGSALWALLPVIGQQLGTGAAGYGALIGCLGVGAVGAGLVVGRARTELGLERLVHSGCVIFAAAMAIAAWARVHAVVYLALVAGGAAWMSVMSTFNTATQTSAPPWVRSRAAALHALSALGAFAFGSAFWGLMSSALGLQAALTIATLAMLGGMLLAKPFPLRMGHEQEVSPAPWKDLFVAQEPDPQAGPVAVEIAYRIHAEDAPEFLDALSQLRAPRRRDGATLWRIYRDLGDPSRYCERFIVTSWADYLHQRSRATLADQELEARVRAFVPEGETVTMQHYIAER
ncbi:MAG TPA: MFS transporter [Burkholderiaceae bacterium]|nr:MFS transporter [Burkholderiaceae bacterium]